MSDSSEPATQIASFRLPDGYTATVTPLLDALSAVSLTHPSGPPLILLYQIPSRGTASLEALAQEFTPGAASFVNAAGETVQFVGRVPVRIRGQETLLTIEEWPVPNAFTMRRASAVFAGPHTPVFLMFYGAKDTWDQAIVDAFIRSIV